MKHPLSLRDIELPRFDPFGLPAFNARPYILGMPVVIEQPRPRYVLPADVPPPTGMTRDEFAAWSKEWCGHAEPLMLDGHVMNLHGTLYMTAATFAQLQAKLAADADVAKLAARMGARRAV